MGQLMFSRQVNNAQVMFHTMKKFINLFLDRKIFAFKDMEFRVRVWVQVFELVA